MKTRKNEKFIYGPGIDEPVIENINEMAWKFLF
jgi:hypothetical protein